MSRDIPIKRKLTALFLLTSGAVLFLTCAAYFDRDTADEAEVRRVAVELFGRAD